MRILICLLCCMAGVLHASARSLPMVFVTDVAVIEHATMPVAFDAADAIRPQVSRQDAAWSLSSEMPFPEFVDAPFVAFAVVWQLKPGSEQYPVLEWRVKTGSGWSGWQPLPEDAHSTHASARVYSTLGFAESDAGLFQVRTDRPSVLDTLTLHCINPGRTRAAGEPEQREATQADAEPSQSIPRPPWVNRTSWGNPNGQTPTFTPRYTAVEHIIVHHTATPNEGSNHDWRAVVRSIWSYHVNTRGWDDIGYNFLIDPNGVLYEGRAGGDGVVGAHFSCANGNTAGIAFLGTFTAVRPSEFALGRLVDTCTWICSHNGLDPVGSRFHSGTGLLLDVIAGHLDGNDAVAPGACPSGTICPGTRLYRLLPDIREDVRLRLDPDSGVSHGFLHTQ